MSTDRTDSNRKEMASLEGGTATADTPKRQATRRIFFLTSLLLLVALITFGLTALLVTIFERRQEARQPFVRVVEIDEATTNPVPWGINWPHQFDTYRRTVDTTETRYGGSSAMPASRLEENPWMRRLYAGYAFSLDYREARGHAYMLYDQEVTERVTQRTQTGACLHCHSSVIPTYRRVGLESLGEPADPNTLAADFNWPAVMEGFRRLSLMNYSDANRELYRTVDGTRGESLPLLPGSSFSETVVEEVRQEMPPDKQHGHPAPEQVGRAHPVSCIDCHDPQTMQIRITRPAFLIGIAALADSHDELPHMPSIERWRAGNRQQPYDPNLHADRQEMRSFVCAQCHVEYYCASKELIFYPWENGLKVEQMEATYENHLFPDGTPFYDYLHGETGAVIYKAQHPEFELWSQGIHARSGVSCADCHMPYERHGAMKVSSHWVRSPLLSINRSCQTCHNVPEQELLARVRTTQSRTQAQMDRAAEAMTDMLDAILEAQAAGATEEELAPILELQRKGMWRLDFISSENSFGFHADQEAMRILGESIDYSRQAQAMSHQLRAPVAPTLDQPSQPVEGVTPTEKAPLSPDTTPDRRSQ